MAHALLSPSGASRWLACTPSARLEAQFPDTAGEAAREGTLAHHLGELLIKQKTNRIAKPAFERELKKIKADPLYENAMLGYADDYAVFVMEKLAEALTHTKDAKLYLEQKLDMTAYVPEGFGTGDAMVIADSVLDFIDLKYGKGVSVSAVENRQMMLYALGALHAFHFMYNIHTIRMTIYQPRIDNISEWEISVEDLMKWTDTELVPKAKLAFAGEGEFIPGKHCQFCRVRATCKANAAFQLELAQYDFKDGALLEDNEVADILDRHKAFTDWLKAVSDHALSEAVNNGKKWPGYKLVEGRSNRQYLDQTLVAEKLLKAGFEKDLIYKPEEILGITDMEATITKKVFAATLADLVVKPPGKPTLVSVTDKREEINSLAKASADFS